jgi:hypothetical protein
MVVDAELDDDWPVMVVGAELDDDWSMMVVGAELDDDWPVMVVGAELEDDWSMMVVGAELDDDWPVVGADFGVFFLVKLPQTPRFLASSSAVFCLRPLIFSLIASVSFLILRQRMFTSS